MKAQRRTGTQGRMPCENRGRDWNDTAVSPRTRRIATHHQELRLLGRTLPLDAKP